MTVAVREVLIDNKAWKYAKPALSVLIPFYRDDPCTLIDALGQESADVELVLLDDAGGDAVLSERVAAAVQTARLPTRLIRLSSNQGRAMGRNRLASHARAERLLFLDSDMLPDHPGFLARWLETEGDVAFGGFTLDQTPLSRRHALHRHMALRTDCLSADLRSQQPEKHVFTSNLLVSRRVFDAIRFDEAFSGWGWEDVEWAMRVSKVYPILHIDNSASHLGLDDAEMLARKYEQSAGNFSRVVAAHPAMVSDYPSFRAAKALKRAPMRKIWRPILKGLALTESLPVAARDLCMRLYRAALYAEAV